MKKLLFILLLFITIAVNGQIIFPGIVASSEISDNSELITNGTFDSDSYWVLGGSWAIALGVATYDDIASPDGIYQTDGDMVSPIANSVNYRAEFDINIPSGNAYFYITNIASSVIYVTGTYYANGHHIVDFTTPASVSPGGFKINAYSQTTEAFELDNLSLKLN